MTVLKIKTMWSVGGGGVQVTSIPLWIVKMYSLFLIKVHTGLGFHKYFLKLYVPDWKLYLLVANWFYLGKSEKKKKKMQPKNELRRNVKRVVAVWRMNKIQGE